MLFWVKLVIFLITISGCNKEILEYIPNIEMNDLKPRVSGVRAQAVSSSGDLVDDFVFQEGEQSLHVLNSPSPAATASFAIGEYIAKKVV